MKKLRLDIDELQVEAFPTTVLRQDANGTVFAHSLNPNCTYTEDGGPCMVSGDGCIPWSDPAYYCRPSYCCDSATDCSFANTNCCSIIPD
jgi:hypothetical protein